MKLDCFTATGISCCQVGNVIAHLRLRVRAPSSGRLMVALLRLLAAHAYVNVKNSEKARFREGAVIAAVIILIPP